MVFKSWGWNGRMVELLLVQSYGSNYWELLFLKYYLGAYLVYILGIYWVYIGYIFTWAMATAVPAKETFHVAYKE